MLKTNYDNIKFKTNSVSPWGGHRPFVYDLVNFVKPKQIVELGAYRGYSLFTMAQAIENSKLDTKIIGIDLWHKGDIHSEFDGNKVYNEVLNESKKYPSVDIDTIRDYFTNAKTQVKSESCDIIHIDGLHTYEAVKEDFENYLPKLKENGVILFHDIAEYTAEIPEFGAYKFFNEIKQKYPHFQFEYSFGLGVLFPKGDKIYQELQNNFGIQKIVNYYSNNYHMKAMVDASRELTFPYDIVIKLMKYLKKLIK